MAGIKIKRAPVTEPLVEKVVLELTHEEAICLQILTGQQTGAMIAQVKRETVNLWRKYNADDVETVNNKNISAVFYALSKTGIAEKS